MGRMINEDTLLEHDGQVFTAREWAKRYQEHFSGFSYQEALQMVLIPARVGRTYRVVSSD